MSEAPRDMRRRWTLAFVTFALRGLSRRPLSTALILFALTVALTVTLMLRALLAGIEVQAERDLAKVGLDLINVHISPSFRNVALSPLRLEHCATMEEITGGKAAPFRVTLGTVNSKTSSVSTVVLNVTPAWSDLVPLDWVSGSFFKDPDEPVCVLDEWVKKELFGDGEAVGETVKIYSLGATLELEVCGVLADPFQIRSRFSEFDIMGTARSRMLGMMEFKSVYVPRRFTSPEESIHGAVIKVPEDRDPDVASDELLNELGTFDQSIWIWSRNSWVGRVLRAANLGATIAGAIGWIVLVVVGVMITTIYLVAVRERYREIAIRRTEGGRRSEIVAQLLMENVALSALAGGIGLGLAHLAGPALEARYISWELAFLPSDVLLVLFVGLVLGALATILPAFRAASLDPVEVLRNA